jgi:hypothetical protein
MTQMIGRRWIAVAVALAAAVNVSGQSAAPARQDDVLAALLTEVKGLRAAMEQMASAGPRVQLFASRLQLQETRMNNMMRRLDTVRDSLASARREQDAIQTHVTQTERAAASGAASHIPAEELEQLAASRKSELRVARATVDRYAAEEVQLVADLTTEQGRWLEINARLDELEKALSRR